MAKAKMYKRPDGLYEKGITINGKRVRFRGKTEREVLQKIAEYHEKEENGRTFEDVADDWYEKISREIQPTTLKRSYDPLYKRAVNHFGDMYIKDIKAKDINSFVSTIITLSQKSVRNHLSIVKQILDYGVLVGEIESNPAIYVKIPKGLSKTKRQMISKEQIELINNNIDYPVFGMFAYFLLYTGCRRGEALALKWSDIDFKNNIINIDKSVYYNSNKAEFKGTKTDAGTREIILLNNLAEKLKGRHNKQHFVFSMDGGTTPLTQSQALKGWAKYCEHIGLEDVTPHMLRHTYASILYEAGIDVKSAQDLLGHADIQTTQNIYTHITKDKKAETANKLNAHFEKKEY